MENGIVAGDAGTAVEGRTLTLLDPLGLLESETLLPPPPLSLLLLTPHICVVRPPPISIFAHTFRVCAFVSPAFVPLTFRLAPTIRLGSLVPTGS